MKPGSGVILLAMCAAVGIAACGDREPGVKTASVDAHGLPATASPSAKLIGVPPAEVPSAPTAGTAPVPVAASTDVEQKAAPTPLPGQPNDHSNLAPNASQKAGAADPQQSPERKSP